MVRRTLVGNQLTPPQSLHGLSSAVRITSRPAGGIRRQTRCGQETKAQDRRAVSLPGLEVGCRQVLAAALQLARMEASLQGLMGACLRGLVAVCPLDQVEDSRPALGAGYQLAPEVVCPPALVVGCQQVLEAVCQRDQVPT